MEITNEAEYWLACREALRQYRQLARMGPENVKAATMRPWVQRIVNELGAAEIAIDKFERHREYLNRDDRDPMGATAPVQHISLYGNPVFLGSFPDLESLMDAFDIEDKDLEGYEILLAYALEESCSGSCYVLLLRHDGELFEIEGSHCSCYGFEDRWDPHITTIGALERRVENDHRHDSEEREALRRVVAALRGGHVALDVPQESGHVLVPVELDPIPTPAEVDSEEVRHIERAAAELRPVIEARALEVGAL